MRPYVEAHPEEEEQRSAQEGQPRAQAQHGPQLLTSRSHQIRRITLGDDPKGWSALGFHVKVPAGTAPANVAGCVQLGNTAVALTGTGAGFAGWAVDGITRPIDGIPTVNPGAAASAPPHPNGITTIDHVVVHTGDVNRTAAALSDAGLQPRRDQPALIGGSPMRQQFYWLGDVILELLGPDEGAPTSDDPAHVFGLALVSGDLDATVSVLGDLAGTAKAAVQPGRRIAAIRGARVGVSIPLAVMSPHPRRH